jgi:hypothetical protein
MATSVVTQTFDSGTDQDINILATNKYRAPFSRTVDLSYLQADANGSKLIKAGSIFVDIPSSNYVRPLPLTRVSVAALAATDTTVTVADAKLFKNAEALIIPRPYATLTFAGTVATGNTITLTLQGQALTYTLVAGDTTATITATSFAAFINAGVASDKILAIASGAIVYFYSKTGIPYLFATSVTGGGVTSTASAATMQENVAIASIHASTAINTTTNVITLAAGSAVAQPIGAPIGVAVKHSAIIGLSVEKRLISTTQALQQSLSNDVNIYDYADIYTSLIPYWDEAISLALPKITSVPRG